MSATKNAVIADALALSEADRLDVIEQLSFSVESTASVAASWEAEIDRRLEDIAAGRATFVPWERARRQIMGDSDAPRS